MSRPVLAFDIGGTKMLAALVQDGRCLEQRSAATPADQPVETWLNRAAGLAAEWRGRCDRAAIAATGVVVGGCWSTVNDAVLPIPPAFPLVAEMGARLGIPVTALNDAQAAAWGEHRLGAGRGRDIVFMTVSTGVGGGIVSHGRLLVGARGIAGHIGRLRLGLTLDAAKLEDVASGGAIRRAMGRPAEEVFAAADVGAAWAVASLDRVVDALAAAMASLQAILDPDCIVLGGGVGLAPGFAQRIRDRLAELPTLLRPELVTASLGAEAGLIGVADYATHQRGFRT